MSALETLKRQAAVAAVELARSGTVVGLGSGSTARYAIMEIGARLADGRLSDVRGVPTSSSTERLARERGVPLIELPADGVDLAIDGMDEVDSRLRAIKGLGGALTREKVVAESARRFVLIGDHGKLVERLGERRPVPVEVLEFGWRRTARLLEGLGLQPRLRRSEDGAAQLTDNGNLIVDCGVPGGADLEGLAARLDGLPGAVGHGLFLGLAQQAIIAGPDGLRRLGEAA